MNERRILLSTNRQQHLAVRFYYGCNSIRRWATGYSRRAYYLRQSMRDHAGSAPFGSAAYSLTFNMSNTSGILHRIQSR